MELENPVVLIVRMSAIGDCIETIPLATAIRERWPGARIDWVVDCAAEQLLKAHPAIRNVIRLPKGFLKKPGFLLDLRKRLRAERYDVAIDPQGLFKSAVVTWLSNARRRIGFASPQSREKAWWFYHHAVVPTKTHLVDRQLELLKPIGIPSPIARFDFQSPENAKQSMREWLRQHQIPENGFVLLNPGAGWASRRWPLERFSEVAAQLGNHYAIPTVVLWAGESEHDMAKSIQCAAGSSCHVAPSTSLTELAGLISLSRWVITGDTGPMHLAAALGTTTVALFGTTRAEYSGPYGENHIRLQKRYQAGTRRQKRVETNEAMQEIEVADVMDACRKLMASNVSV